jgi:hypothetical protein
LRDFESLRVSVLSDADFSFTQAPLTAHAVLRTSAHCKRPVLASIDMISLALSIVEFPVLELGIPLFVRAVDSNHVEGVLQVGQSYEWFTGRVNEGKLIFSNRSKSNIGSLGFLSQALIQVMHDSICINIYLDFLLVPKLPESIRNFEKW